MAILIKEILASDTISNMVDKINENFDQVLLNGGGIQGMIGGDGPIGPIGPRGTRGSKWFTGTDDPNLHVFGENLIDGDQYIWDNSTTFTYQIWRYSSTTLLWTYTNIDLNISSGGGSSSVVSLWNSGGNTIYGSGSVFQDGEDFLFIPPSDELRVVTGDDTYDIKSVLIGGYPTTMDTPPIQGAGAPWLNYISDTYAAAIKSNSAGLLFLHDTGGVPQIVFSNHAGTDIVADMPYILSSIEDNLTFHNPRSIQSALLDGLKFTTDDTDIITESGRSVILRTTGNPTTYDSGLAGSNAAGDIYIIAKDYTSSTDGTTKGTDPGDNYTTPNQLLLKNVITTTTPAGDRYSHILMTGSGTSLTGNRYMEIKVDNSLKYSVDNIQTITLTYDGIYFNTPGSSRVQFDGNVYHNDYSYFLSNEAYLTTVDEYAGAIMVTGGNANLQIGSGEGASSYQSNGAFLQARLDTDIKYLYLNPLGGYVKLGGYTEPASELDVTGVITTTGGDSDDWNSAFGWNDHSIQGYLKDDGSVALTQNWNAGGYYIRSRQFYSDATGTTPPFIVQSEARVSKLNADKLDNYHASHFLFSTIDDTISANYKTGSPTSSKDSGIYGNYNSTVYSNIWGVSYVTTIATDGSTLDSFSGAVNSYESGPAGNLAGGHQFIWVNTGVIKSVLGDNIYTTGQFISTKASGAPLVVASTGRVDNLNVEYFNDQLASYYAVDGHLINSHDTTATGPELTTLTDGSNADALHNHAETDPVWNTWKDDNSHIVNISLSDISGWDSGSNLYLSNTTTSTVVIGDNTNIYSNTEGTFENRYSLVKNNIVLGVNAGKANPQDDPDPRFRGSYNIIMGLNAAFTLILADNSIILGQEAGYLLEDGDANIFIGYQSGRSIVDSTYNTLIGYQSGKYLTGEYNIALGSQALMGKSSNNSSDDHNIGIGRYTGFNLQTNAKYNILMGYYAGGTLGNHDNNIFIGYLAGRYAVADNNIAIGYEALGGNTALAGNDNVAIGRLAGKTLSTTAYSNVVIGANAGPQSGSGNTAYKNVIIGKGAGDSVTTGFENVIIGESAGASITAGQENVLIGVGTGGAITTLDYNTIIGWNAGLITSGASNVMLGQSAGVSNTTGSSNTYIGRGAGSDNVGSSNVFIGNFAGELQTVANNKLIIANSNVQELITGSFTSDTLSLNADVTIRDFLVLDNVAHASLSGTFTIAPTSSFMSVDAAGGVTSDASTAIDDGDYDGQILIITNTTTNPVTIKNGANTRMAGDVTLGNYDTISYIWLNTDWLETSRSDNS